MGHSTSKFQMGTTGSNIKEVVNNVGTRAAGLVVRRKSDGTLSLTKADGEIFGVSLGADLSNAGQTAVCKRGLKVPVQLKAGFDPTIGAVVSIDDATGLACGDGTRTATAAVYATGRIGGTGVNGGQQEDGTTVGVALVDIPGGF
jgi:hypothetical protein